MDSNVTPDYLDLKALSCRVGLSTRTLRSAIHDPIDPLPAYRAGKWLVKWTEAERWIRRHRVRDAGRSLQMDDLALEVWAEATDGKGTTT